MRKYQKPSIERIAFIESLDIEAKGVARISLEDDSELQNSKNSQSISDQKQQTLSSEQHSKQVVFIPDTLPGEKVKFRITQRKKRHLFATATEILEPSPLRQTPACEYYGICGGCSMQHIDDYAQVAFKQRILEDNLRHIGKTKPNHIIPPIIGNTLGYRHRGRLSVKFIQSKQTLLIGFHERGTHFVTRMSHCLVLHPLLGLRLPEITECLSRLSIRENIPQIEFAIGDETLEYPLALTLRILLPLSVEDVKILQLFSDQHKIQLWLQTKGLDTATLWYPLNCQLTYLLPDFNITIPFKPIDFTQVNHKINQVMIRQAIELLQIQVNHRILDLFCGIGNFTLPIAQKAAQTMGIEGNESLVERAKSNALYNQLNHKTQFEVSNLFHITSEQIQEWGFFDRWLIDPPREGAQAVVNAIAQHHQKQLSIESTSDILPPIIVYISCNPATLARDAAILTQEAGYQMDMTGIINMFPNTSHVESMARFSRQTRRITSTS